MRLAGIIVRLGRIPLVIPQTGHGHGFFVPDKVPLHHIGQQVSLSLSKVEGRIAFPIQLQLQRVSIQQRILRHQIPAHVIPGILAEPFHGFLCFQRTCVLLHRLLLSLDQRVHKIIVKMEPFPGESRIQQVFRYLLVGVRIREGEVERQTACMSGGILLVNDGLIHRPFYLIASRAVGPVVHHEIQQVNLFEHAVAEGFRVASRPGQALVVDFHQAPLVLKKLLHRIQDRLNLRKIDEGEGIGLVVRPLFFHGDKIIYDETAQVLDRHPRILCQRIQPLGIEPPGAGLGLLRGDHIIRIGGEHLCRLHRTHEAGVESHKIKMHAGGPERIADIAKLQDIIRIILVQPVPHERAAAVIPQDQGVPI